MKAILDTSVYFSMLISPRGSGVWLMALWFEGRYELVVSPRLFAELADMTYRPEVQGRMDAQRRLALFRRLRQDAIWTKGALHAEGLLADAQNDSLMAAALETGAEFIVAWDSALLD